MFPLLLGSLRGLYFCRIPDEVRCSWLAFHAVDFSHFARSRSYLSRYIWVVEKRMHER